jgi:hypothetical protein
MAGAFQASAFQNNAFQVGGVVDTVPPATAVIDLSQSVNRPQIIDTYLGPSIGWVEKLVRSSILINVPGTYAIKYAGTILVNIADPQAAFILPDVGKWLQDLGGLPPSDFDGSIWVKDLGGKAGTFNIKVFALAGQLIDGSPTFTLIQNRQIAKFVPLNDLSGWYVGALLAALGLGSVLTYLTDLGGMLCA